MEAQDAAVCFVLNLFAVHGGSCQKSNKNNNDNNNDINNNNSEKESI